MLELGTLPTSGSVCDATLDAVDPTSPLVLVFCVECALVQTLPGVPVRGGTCDADRPSAAAAEDEADRLSLVSSRPLGPRSLVVEIGSGDGSLLQSLAAGGITVLGVERSTAAAFSAAAAGVPTITDPFDRELATRLRAGGLGADVIVASHVIDAVDGLNRFVEGLRILVADHGAIVVDTPYVLDIVDRVGVGALHHDRRSYFSATSLDALVRRHGLFLNDVEVHAERSVDRLRCRVEPREAMTERCEALLSTERDRGVGEVSCYDELDRRVQCTLDELHALLESIHSHGHSIAAYGADPDVVTLLNAAGVGVELVDFVVDPDALLHGMLVPGVRVPIVAPEMLRRAHTDFLLVQGGTRDGDVDPAAAAFVASGGRLIVVQPTPRIVGAPR